MIDSNGTLGFSGQKVPSSSISLLVSLLATGVPTSLARFSMALTLSGSRFERGISLFVNFSRSKNHFLAGDR